MAVHKIEFSLNGRNRVTAQSIMDTIQQRLSDLSTEYSVVSRWPFRIELTESQYLLLCVIHPMLSGKGFSRTKKSAAEILQKYLEIFAKGFVNPKKFCSRNFAEVLRDFCKGSEFFAEVSEDFSKWFCRV